MVALHAVGGVDDAPNLGRVVEVSRDLRPVGLPGADGHRVLRPPALSASGVKVLKTSE